MKRFPRVALMTVAHVLLFGSLFGVLAQEKVMTGAYAEASVTNPDVIAAAKFAVKAEMGKQGVPISLVSIQHAEVQVVAGLNFRLDLKVNNYGIRQDVRAVVYRNLRNVFSLSKWEVVEGRSSSTAFRITAIKAMLFYDGKGAFSRDVLSKPDFTFWNTIIGEGDAEGPSNSTLVLVEVSGNPSRDEATPARQVNFSAMAGRRVLLKKVADIGLFSDDGKFYAAFWLYNTGCDPVKLSARITGQSQSSTMSKTIPFKCGE